MDETQKRKEIEIAHQAEVASRKPDIQPTPDYIIERFRQAKLWRFFPKEFVFRQIRDFRGKEILDFGCGDGEISTQLAKMGARVTALDISPELVDLARRRAVLDGVEDRIEFIAGDITRSPLPENKFDHIVGYAVIHHVDIAETVPLLYSCLKPGGTALLVEPAAFSPWLQKIRNLVPVKKEASPAERQLNWKDLNLTLSFFDSSRVTYFECLGRLQRLFPNRNKIDRGHVFTKAGLILIHGADRLMVNLFPPLCKYYGTVVIVAGKSGSTRT